MATYQGNSADHSRARTLANERENAAVRFKALQDEIRTANQVHLNSIETTFTSDSNTKQEAAFKASTIGLVSAADFKKKRLEVEAAVAEAEAHKLKLLEKDRKRKGKEREKQRKALTFHEE